MGSTRLCMRELVRSGNDNTRLRPSPVFLQLRRTADDTAIDEPDIRSGLGEQFICCASRARAYGIQVKEIQWVVPLGERGVRGCGDNPLCDGDGITLRDYAEDVVGLVGEVGVSGD